MVVRDPELETIERGLTGIRAESRALTNLETVLDVVRVLAGAAPFNGFLHASRGGDLLARHTCAILVRLLGAATSASW